MKINTRKNMSRVLVLPILAFIAYGFSLCVTLLLSGAEDIASGTIGEHIKAYLFTLILLSVMSFLFYIFDKSVVSSDAEKQWTQESDRYSLVTKGIIFFVALPLVSLFLSALTIRLANFLAWNIGSSVTVFITILIVSMISFYTIYRSKN